MVEKIDLKKELKFLYEPSARAVEVVDVPEFRFLMIDGQIKPGEAPAESPAFQEAMQTLFGLSYTLKFISKLRKENPIDYTVMAVEGLWWLESGTFDLSSKVPWFYRMMILQPSHITDEMVGQAVTQLRKKSNNPTLPRVSFEPFHEGLSIQIMHVGPYAEETHTVEKLKAYAHDNGYRISGRHHEIYLGDPRRSKPDQLRTILRYPVEKLH